MMLELITVLVLAHVLRTFAVEGRLGTTHG